MSAALQVVDNEAPTGLTARQIEIIKTQLAPGIDDASLMFFGATCARTGLDPVLRQIYIIGRDSKHKDERGNWHTTKKWTIQVGIDGLQLIAARSRQWAGVDLPTFGPLDDEGHPEWAAVTVYRLVHGQRMPFSNVAYWAEYVQLKDEYGADGKKTGVKLPTDMWAKMPRSQLAKCARAGAIRMGFPAETAGVYADVEMQQADNPSAPQVVEQASATRDQVAQLANVLHIGATERKALFAQHGGDLNAIYRELTARAAREADAPAVEEAHDLSELHVPGTNS